MIVYDGVFKIGINYIGFFGVDMVVLMCEMEEMGVNLVDMD